MSRGLSRLWHLMHDEDGQDLVEYAFLTLFIALVTAAALLALQGAIGRGYSNTNAAVDGLWRPPDPT
jgi:Flp pilus assembly pilin Flp